MLTRDEIGALDSSNMAGTVSAFAQHIEDAVRIGSTAPLRKNVRSVRSVVVTGLGGSAIGGDLLRCYLADSLSIPFVVNRSYELPAFVNQSTLVVVSSYSGNTEETIAAHRDALKRKAQVVAVTSGGHTSRIARRAGHSWIELPAGFHPRAALAYSFFTILMTLIRLGLVRPLRAPIREAIDTIASMSNRLSDPASLDNEALSLASTLHGTVPLIYSPVQLEAVNLRWRTQIEENAKQLAFGNVLPEMNHNEIVGWKQLPNVQHSLSAVFLADRETPRRIALRERFTQEILQPRAASLSVVHSLGRSRLARMFSLVHLGDWVSLYLAFLNGEDPSPVAVIDRLKEQLRTA